MAARFYSEVSAEERDEWRKHPVTIAAMAMLREHEDNEAQDVFRATGATPDGELKYNLGFHAGISSAIDLLENDE